MKLLVSALILAGAALAAQAIATGTQTDTRGTNPSTTVSQGHGVGLLGRIRPTAVPEPGTSALLLLGSGFVVATYRHLRQR